MSSTFTTQPHGYVKRGNKTVRTRCLEFIETLAIQGVKEMPVQEAKILFNQIIDEWDPKTEVRYFGNQVGFSQRKIERIARYQTGTISRKMIDLKQFIPHKKGYLERLGLVQFELRGRNVQAGKDGTWFLKVQNSPIVPELVKALVQPTNDKISIYPIHGTSQGDSLEPSLGSVLKEGSIDSRRERGGGLHREGDIYRSSESDLLSTPIREQTHLTAEEKRILEARP